MHILSLILTPTNTVEDYLNSRDWFLDIAGLPLKHPLTSETCMVPNYSEGKITFLCASLSFYKSLICSFLVMCDMLEMHWMYINEMGSC